MNHKVAIITGAGSGIGRAAALAFLEADYRVVLAGRTVKTLEETLAMKPIKANHALPIRCDVTDVAQVQALFSQTHKHFGHLDVLFNNAGISGSGGVALEELSQAQWLSVINTNINGMFYCLQQAFALMKLQNPQGGRIINNGSIAAYAPRLRSIAYTASKHAVTGMTKAANIEGRAYNIAVGQIDVGNAATDMTQAMQKGTLQANGQLLQEPVMDVALVGQAVLQMAQLPLSANVLFQTIMATQMPFVGRG